MFKCVVCGHISHPREPRLARHYIDQESKLVVKEDAVCVRCFEGNQIWCFTCKMRVKSEKLEEHTKHVIESYGPGLPLKVQV